MVVARPGVSTISGSSMIGIAGKIISAGPRGSKGGAETAARRPSEINSMAGT